MSQNPPPVVSVDLATEDAPLPATAELLDPTVVPPPTEFEKTQKWLAYILAASIPLIVLSVCVTLVLKAMGYGSDVALGDVKDLVVGLLGPVGALVGTVLGFYFGERRGQGRVLSAPRKPGGSGRS